MIKPLLSKRALSLGPYFCKHTKMSSDSSPETSNPPVSGRQTSRDNFEARTIMSLIQEGVSPRVLLSHLVPSMHLPSDADDMTLWRILMQLIEPAKRDKLMEYNTIDDAINLIRKSKNILVLSGAGISTSAGIPDFRSRNGIYVQIHAEHPDLADPKYMFDIEYFRQNPSPFYQFARALYPGQYRPTIGHKFIKTIEDRGKLLRNYTQNIDTLERQAGIKKVIECHGSFASASCTSCKYQVDGDEIGAEIMNQKVPLCPKCHVDGSKPLDGLGVMKPDIVFFGEALGDTFHRSLDHDKDIVDLLIVIGSSLKVRPVALIPRSVPSNVPQILINKEPLDHMTFDIELLGDCDNIIQELCLKLGDGWTGICDNETQRMTERLGPPPQIKPSQEATKQSSDAVSGGGGGGGGGGESEKKKSDDKATTEAKQDESDVPNTTTTTTKNDSDEEWEDIGVISSGEDDSDDEYSHHANYVELDLPKTTYYHLKPNRYLFAGAELTQRQLERFSKKSAQLEMHDAPQ